MGCRCRMGDMAGWGGARPAAAALDWLRSPFPLAAPGLPPPPQSAAKCPILAAFRCEQEDELGCHERVQACIFKVGDDCRQDVLALQVMRLLKRAFDAAGLPLYLAPYGVVPTGHEQGIIEVIPQAKSRAQLVRRRRGGGVVGVAGVRWSGWAAVGGRWCCRLLLLRCCCFAASLPCPPPKHPRPPQGEMFDGGLFEIFQHEFGMPGSRRFEATRAAFLESTAAYSVATYILWAKARCCTAAWRLVLCCRWEGCRQDHAAARATDQRRLPPPPRAPPAPAASRTATTAT